MFAEFAERAEHCWRRCPRAETGGVFEERVAGNCIERGWRICLSVKGWVGTVVVVAEGHIGLVAGIAVAGACRSAVASSSAAAAAVVAIAAEAFQSVEEPFVSA